MTELVHFGGGAVTWSQAVSRVADALNPLGAARDIVAQLSACYVEVQQLKIQLLDAENRHTEISSSIQQRQNDMHDVVAELARDAREYSTSSTALRQSLADAQRNAIDRFIAADERKMWIQLLPVLGSQIVEQTRLGMDHSVRIAEIFDLGGMQFIAETWKRTS